MRGLLSFILNPPVLFLKQERDWMFVDPVASTCKLDEIESNTRTFDRKVSHHHHHHHQQQQQQQHQVSSFCPKGETIIDPIVHYHTFV